MLDFISITTTEFAAVRDLLSCDTITVSITSDSITEEYLLLVRRDSGVKNLTKNRPVYFLVDLQQLGLVVLGVAACFNSTPCKAATAVNSNINHI